MKNLTFYLLVVLVGYWAVGLLFHFPMMYGAFLFVPLTICLLMLLFMVNDHKDKADKETHHH